jgi:biofilm protein TabA
MIIAELGQAGVQAASTPALVTAFDYLKHLDLNRLEVGRYAIDDDRVFAIVAFYTTRIANNQVVVEGHCKYIDLQFVASGQEMIGWTPAVQVQSRSPYDAGKDAWVCNLPAEVLAWMKVCAGQVAVLYPSDAHAPQFAAGGPSLVKKVVVKVAVP